MNDSVLQGRQPMMATFPEWTWCCSMARVAELLNLLLTFILALGDIQITQHPQHDKDQGRAQNR